MKATEKSFRSIDGIPVYYLRNADKVPRRMTLRGTEELYNRLVAFKRDLDLYTRPAGYGSITRFYSAGAYVNKSGEHGRGRAFDLDRVEWSSGRACSPIYGVHDHSKQWARLRYYALDAVCRQHFRPVLDATFNRAHEDHFHIDLSRLPVQLSRSFKSEVPFIQTICNEFANQRLVVDGSYGPLSAKALRRTLDAAGLRGLDPMRSTRDYRKFLQRISQKGFRAQTFN